MAFYIVLFIICVGIMLIMKKKRASQVAFIILWMVYAFRNQVAVDDSSYIQAFDYINRGWGYDIEFTYQILAKFAYSFGMSYKFIFLVYGTISIFFLYKTIDLIYNTNVNKALYMASFFGTVFVSSMSVMRQFLAACLYFYAVVYLHKKRKMVLPIIISIIAATFHGGSIVAIPLLLLFRPQVNIKYTAKISILMVCIVSGYLNIATFMFRRVLKLLPVSYQIYSNELSGSFSSAGQTLSYVLLLLFMAQCIFSMRMKQTQLSSEMNVALEKGQFIYLCLLFFFVHAGVASRLAFTFIPFIATLPLTFSMRIKRKDRALLSPIIIACMFVLYIMTLHSVSLINSGFFIPYQGSFDFWS